VTEGKGGMEGRGRGGDSLNRHCKILRTPAAVDSITLGLPFIKFPIVVPVLISGERCKSAEINQNLYAIRNPRSCAVTRRRKCAQRDAHAPSTVSSQRLDYCVCGEKDPKSNLNPPPSPDLSIIVRQACPCSHIHVNVITINAMLQAQKTVHIDPGIWTTRSTLSRGGCQIYVGRSQRSGYEVENSANVAA